MGVLIDTSFLVAGEKAGIRLSELRGALNAQDCFISVVTASELLVGVHRATHPVARLRRSRRVEEVLDDFEIIPVELPVARVHARIQTELAVRGTPIGPHDLWIAASAVTHGHAVATLNVREFERVPGLVVERWTL